MSLVYCNLVRPLLFLQDSEVAHDRVLGVLAWSARRAPLRRALRRMYGQEPPLPVRLFGLDFPNPVGLAAGLDKRGEALPAWAALGFGFTELGGVTWHAQPGNDKPRMFRAPAEEALVNRMGFNNPGAEAMAQTLAGWRESGLWPAHPVGVNLGKSKITPLPEAAGEYARSFAALWDCADFFVVNVSSPNTPNLRQLQDKALLDEILAAIQGVNDARAASASTPSAPPRPKPVLVKVAPDLSWVALDQILELTGPRRVAGLIATNTTVCRPQPFRAKSEKIYAEPGGLSGRPLHARSTEVIRHLYRQSAGRLPIIGVGGIACALDAWEKITAGASLVQIYTGFVYEGPTLPGHVVSGLRYLLERDGLTRLEQAVGLDHRREARS